MGCIGHFMCSTGHCIGCIGHCMRCTGTAWVLPDAVCVVPDTGHCMGCTGRCMAGHVTLEWPVEGAYRTDRAVIAY